MARLQAKRQQMADGSPIGIRTTEYPGQGEKVDLARLTILDMRER